MEAGEYIIEKDNKQWVVFKDIFVYSEDIIFYPGKFYIVYEYTDLYIRVAEDSSRILNNRTLYMNYYSINASAHSKFGVQNLLHKKRDYYLEILCNE